MGTHAVLETADAQSVPSRRADLPLLPIPQGDWSAGRLSNYERESCIHELFERQAEQRPGAVALCRGEARLSYCELNGRANRLAQRLRELGVGPDVLTAVSVERSIEMIVALLAILKAGGAYVPLDRTYPRERLAFMLRDTEAAILIADSGFDRTSVPSGTQVLELAPGDFCGPGAESGNIRSGATAENLAYVMYTSGSTGVPKGVAVPHRAVIRLVRNTNYAEFSPSDVFLQLAPISFDASTFEIWGCLLNGGRLVLFPPHRPSLEELGRTIAREGISTLWLTSGLFHQMIDQQLPQLSGVRQLLAGGDVLSAPHVLKAVRHLPGCRVINGYGPTENTTFTCCHAVPSDWDGAGPVPIGRPISNTQVYILDEQLAPVPIGVPGELYAAGDGLARGYWNRPELTAEKFISNPFAGRQTSDFDGRASKVLYRTGDLARWRADGVIEFLGRKDQQVKIRGFRVEPGEIEAALAEHASVRDAVVVARADSSGTRQLFAYVVPQPEGAFDARALRSFLETKLPEHMIPAQFVALDALPLTPNGKVNRDALPEPDIARATEADSMAPRDPVEQQLADIWREILGTKVANVNDNFFHLGGHSLLATQVVSRVARAFGIELPVRVIFEAPTVALLAEAVKNHSGEQSPAPAAITRRIHRARAQHLLAQLEDLSDAEVEALLRKSELKNAAP